MWKDLEVARKRIVSGYWKQDFQDHFKNLLHDKPCNNTDADKKEKILELIQDIIDSDDITLFNDVRIVLNILNDYFCADIEIRGKWHEGLEMAVSGIICAHYANIDAKFGSGSIIPIVDEHGQTKFQLDFSQGIIDKKKMEEIQVLWNQLLLGYYIYGVTKEEVYLGILELIEMAVKMYKWKLPYEGYKRKREEEDDEEEEHEEEEEEEEDTNL